MREKDVVKNILLFFEKMHVHILLAWGKINFIGENN